MRYTKYVLSVCAFAILVAPLTPAVPAQSNSPAATPLTISHYLSGHLQSGESASYSISLKAGDYAQITVSQLDGWIAISAYDPAGRKIKSVASNPFETFQGTALEYDKLEALDLIALQDGTYRIELTPAHSKACKYDITYAENDDMAQRMKLAPVFHLYESPQISALRKQLEDGHRDALDAFWEKVKTQGEPLVEPISNDPKHMLVTVLWKDTYGVKNVALAWESYSTFSPEQYTFAHLLDTNLWYITLQLPCGARFVYQLSPNDDLVPATRYSPFDDNARERHEAGLMTDPLNPHHWLQHNGDFSLLELPGSPPQPWIVKHPDTPQGTVVKSRFKSDLLHNDREIAIYTPPGYSANHSPYWLMVLFDEEAYLTMVPTPVIVDNLIAAKKIPPMVVVFVSAVDRQTRRLETMGPSAQKFADAMPTELVPWIRKNYNVTTDPAHTITAGSSANGFTAVYMAWLHPDVFGNVLCQSGGLPWEPGSGLRIGEHPEWLARQLAENPRKPIRFFVEAGLFEDEKEGILYSGRHFRDVAMAKGYEIKYQDFAGGHNYINWRGSLADGLIYLSGSDATSK